MKNENSRIKYLVKVDDVWKEIPEYEREMARELNLEGMLREI